MAIKPVTRSYTFNSSGQVQLKSIIGIARDVWVGSLAIRAASGNVGNVYWSDNDGQAGGYLDATEAVTFNFGEGQALISTFTFSGVENDKIYLTIGIPMYYVDRGEV